MGNRTFLSPRFPHQQASGSRAPPARVRLRPVLQRRLHRRNSPPAMPGTTYTTKDRNVTKRMDRMHEIKGLAENRPAPYTWSKYYYNHPSSYNNGKYSLSQQSPKFFSQCMSFLITYAGGLHLEAVLLEAAVPSDPREARRAPGQPDLPPLEEHAHHCHTQGEEPKGQGHQRKIR